MDGMMKASLLMIILCSSVLMGTADQSCRAPGSTVNCNGFGVCVNGSCQCDKRPNPSEHITGRYCECINFGCPRMNGLICGGPDKGVCECGNCICKNGFSGDNCGQVDCAIGQKECLSDPKNNITCNGNGQCHCDRCECHLGYDGKHCEHCVSCPAKCSMAKDCVLCEAFNESNNGDDFCRKQKCNIDWIFADEVEEQCAFKDANECYTIFQLHSDPITGKEVIRVRKEKRCVIIVKKDERKQQDNMTTDKNGRTNAHHIDSAWSIISVTFISVVNIFFAKN